MPPKLRARLLAGVAPVAVLALGEASEAQAQSAPVRYELYVEGGYAFGAAGVNDIPYAEFNVAGTTANSTFTAEPGDAFFGRVGGAAHWTGPWSGNAAYTGLRASKSSSTPFLVTGGFPILTILAGGLTGTPGLATSWRQAKVHTSVAADVVDFQAGYDVGLGNVLGLGDVAGTVLGGLRYGHIAQNTDAEFFGTGAFVNVAASNHRRSRYWGVGPTLGGKASMPIMGGWSVDGMAVGGVLFGRLNSDTTGQFPPGGGIVTRSISNTRIAETFDGQLALTYTFPMSSTSKLQVSGGYEISFMGGVRDTANGASRPVGLSYGSTSDDLLFQGPFARLKYSF